MWFVKHSVKQQLPGDTRWNSQIDFISSFLRNRPSCQNIVQEHDDEIDNDVTILIHDYKLFKQAKELFQALTPISWALDMFQADNPVRFNFHILFC